MSQTLSSNLLKSLIKYSTRPILSSPNLIEFTPKNRQTQFYPESQLNQVYLISCGAETPRIDSPDFNIALIAAISAILLIVRSLSSS